MKFSLSKSLLLAFTLAAFGCGKDDDIPCNNIEEPAWVKFIGEYEVYDEESVYLYDMSISHYFSGINEIGNPADSLLVTNLADTFDLSLQFQNITDPAILGLASVNPLQDHNGHRWFFSGLSDDLETEVRENKLIDGEMVMYFKMDNTPYYINDGQLFFACDCKHTAIKLE